MKPTTAPNGGELRRQLDAIIATHPKTETSQRRISRRLRCAIEAVRRWICAEAGVPASIVKDRDVARLALELDWAFCYQNNLAIGFATLEEMQVWAGDVLAGREAGR